MLYVVSGFMEFMGFIGLTGFMGFMECMGFRLKGLFVWAVCFVVYFLFPWAR